MTLTYYRNIAGMFNIDTIIFQALNIAGLWQLLLLPFFIIIIKEYPAIKIWSVQGHWIPQSLTKYLLSLGNSQRAHLRELHK